MSGKKIIALFDLDGTLSEARKICTEEMVAYLNRLRKHITIGVVSGSDHDKVNWQLGGSDWTAICDYLFVENGVVAYKDGEKIGSSSISAHLGESNLKELINFVLRYFSDLDIPKKRGTFVEFRTGMLNFSPIGRNCSYDERLEFNEYDKTHGVRDAFVKALNEKFAHMKLRFSIGGQISVDCFPEGWDKTFCLQYLKEYDEIHFFGDKTAPGGNDHEIFEDPRTIGHTVVNPADTMAQLKEIFKVE
uniref:Phosphomannomutase n=1 Tax=Chromera velia CCMP2878 TaxID=1169474 RepID=A0A0G4GD88_9ALVE|mmetsp:Transcript_21678/g.43112  ORF Transcript_21678/g.43112 Transcript_21678/m.43112 type:complete len:247 (-) Transcript_21678:36-776(-)|eukprot:Cvel_4552.t1-p1 / transcript=Cvel_4552.t1 / gene=Cvel_4552 / organism=Chromera_velia_CCMP2878 / gene_product=Phosphomannomutase, putative / transcript_product=Phosphomannomutase, putative / location=Cvel_scaffold199:103948-104685(+) / protein_length=246 / sequence_SO=supercontig / SO=protein_coding / is_pseudo=false